MKCIPALAAAIVLFVIAGCAEREATFRQLGGEPIRFSDFHDKVVFINYWAIWCKPCREEIPALNRFQQGNPEDVVVLAVNFDGIAGDELAQQADDLGIEFGVLLDDPRNAFAVKPSGVLPETLVIDRRGEFHRVLLGPQTEDDLQEVLSSLLEDINYNGSP